MDKFDATIIIPTYNRKHSLVETLESLREQKYPCEGYEVVVVDDGSTDGTHHVANASYPFELRYVRQSNQGSAVARNRGASEAKGNVLIFLDDDMLVGPDYVLGLIEEHRTHERIVGMATEKPYLPPDAAFFARASSLETAQRSAEQAGSFIPFTECVTNNLSVECRDFFEIGMMQDIGGDGPTWWGDVDFGYRAHRLGFRFRRSAHATCIHRDYSIHDLKTTSERSYKAARMAVLLLQKHPDLVDFLPMFQDKLPISWQSDPPRLVMRKAARRLASTNPSLGLMELMANLFEQHGLSGTMLQSLYRWIIGAYIFRGFRTGLQDFG